MSKRIKSFSGRLTRIIIVVFLVIMAIISDLSGWDNPASALYGIDAIPDNLLIDPEGTVVARGLRGEKLQAKLAEIFK
ncbi:MAG: hypothetical protein J6X91_08545 [Bacteroidales bacterium]|nr:hypothetical protein [Bacteroidales bacterium]MBP5518687.1 hypothetical protein [Bacteroidales bacterium]